MCLPVSRPILADWDTTLIEVVIKFMWDGFSVATFKGASESYFQFGYAFVSVAGVDCPDASSRDGLKPLGYAACGEEEGINAILGDWEQQMLQWTGEDHRNVLVKPDGTMRIKIPTPIDATDSDGNPTRVQWIRPVLAADSKAMLEALKRMSASSKFYCFNDVDSCEKCKESHNR